jgi:hypothetical protein
MTEGHALADQPQTVHVVNGSDMVILRRQSLWREVNEQIERLSRASDGNGTIDVLCECGDDGCSAQLSVPLGLYEAVRREPTRFLVRSGHARSEADRVTDERDGYAVIEKTGTSARRAAELDPRRRGR